MKTCEWTTIDKTSWERGPWDAEPDKRQWMDEATGLPCLIVRSPGGGHLCGYVGVPPGHPWHGQHYDKCDADVHGGLTFADRCSPAAEKDPSRYASRSRGGLGSTAVTMVTSPQVATGSVVRRAVSTGGAAPTAASAT